MDTRVTYVVPLQIYALVGRAMGERDVSGYYDFLSFCYRNWGLILFIFLNRMHRARESLYRLI